MGESNEQELVDTGFDAVIAGERYEDAPAVTATVNPAPGPGFTPEGKKAAIALIRHIIPTLPNLTPSDLAKLAREMAMNIRERHVILKEFNLNDAQYDFLEANHEFYAQAYKAACIEWHAPLSTQERIKVEAAAILEDSLIGLGARMQNKAEGLPGVVEVAKLFAKVAGVGEREAGGGPSGERFVINIDLGGDQKINLTTEVAAPAAPQSPVLGAIQSYTKTEGDA